MTDRARRTKRPLLLAAAAGAFSVRYFAQAAFFPYLALWLRENGFEDVERAPILTLYFGGRALAPLCWGALADWCGHHLLVYAVGTFSNTLAVLLLTVRPRSPAWQSVLLAIAGLSETLTLLDAMVNRSLVHIGASRTIGRAFGSLTYAIASPLVGFLTGTFGLRSVLLLYSATALTVPLCALLPVVDAYATSLAPLLPVSQPASDGTVARGAVPMPQPRVAACALGADGPAAAEHSLVHLPRAADDAPATDAPVIFLVRTPAGPPANEGPAAKQGAAAPTVQQSTGRAAATGGPATASFLASLRAHDWLCMASLLLVGVYHALFNSFGFILLTERLHASTSQLGATICVQALLEFPLFLAAGSALMPALGGRLPALLTCHLASALRLLGYVTATSFYSILCFEPAHAWLASLAYAATLEFGESLSAQGLQATAVGAANVCINVGMVVGTLGCGELAGQVGPAETFRYAIPIFASASLPLLVYVPSWLSRACATHRGDAATCGSGAEQPERLLH